MPQGVGYTDAQLRQIMDFHAAKGTPMDTVLLELQRRGLGQDRLDRAGSFYDAATMAMKQDPQGFEAAMMQNPMMMRFLQQQQQPAQQASPIAAAISGTAVPAAAPGMGSLTREQMLDFAGAIRGSFR